MVQNAFSEGLDASKGDVSPPPHLTSDSVSVDVAYGELASA